MVLDELDQVKALAVPVRVEILHMLEDEPMTTTQMARLLGEKPNRLYYHVTELERVGILEVVERKRRGNLYEKYYRPAARFYRIDPALFQKGDEGMQAYLNTVISNFDNTLIDLRKCLADGLIDTEHMLGAFSSIMEVDLTAEQAAEFRRELRDLLVKYSAMDREGAPERVHASNVLYIRRAGRR